MVSFTLRPLDYQGNCSWYPLDRRLGGPLIRSVSSGEEKISQSPPFMGTKIAFLCLQVLLNEIRITDHYFSPPQHSRNIEIYLAQIWRFPAHSSERGLTAIRPQLNEFCSLLFLFKSR